MWINRDFEYLNIIEASTAETDQVHLDLPVFMVANWLF
jgi:hypothetical protein